MSYALLQNERLYLKKETTFGTVPSIAGANACRFTRFTMNQVVNDIQRRDKTGSRSDFQFIKGRRSATWEAVMDLAGNGAAGSKPDSDPLFDVAFGQAGVAAAGASYTYTLGDSIESLSIAAYKNNPTTLNSRIAVGAIVEELMIEFGGDLATLTAKGAAIWGLDSDFFSTADATQRGGLSTFPAEPGTQTYNGTPMPAFTGTLTFGGNSVVELQSATVHLGTANQLVTNTFGTFYGTTPPIGGRRPVTLDFKLFDSDTLAVQTIRNNAQSMTSMAVSLAIGTTAGNICTVTLPAVLPRVPSYGENDLRVDMTFNGCRCLATGANTKDEISIVWT